MALSSKNSLLLCFYDIQYRWTKRSTVHGVEVTIELNENPKGQQVIAQCPRIFRDDMVEEIIEQALPMGWKPDEEGKDPLRTRLTKKGLSQQRPQ